MVIIRLARFGKKKHPTYRFVVSDKRRDTKGRYLEALGAYNPHTQPATIDVKVDRVKYWLSVGADMSDSVHNLFVDKGIVPGPKRKFVKPKKKDEPEAKPAEVASAEAPKAETASGEAGSGSAGKAETPKPEKEKPARPSPAVLEPAKEPAAVQEPAQQS